MEGGKGGGEGWKERVRDEIEGMGRKRRGMAWERKEEREE